MAYDVMPVQILGGPSWVRSERFAIEAVVAGPVKVDQVRAMLQWLLAERFKLVLYREVVTTSVYELIPVSSGLKITPLKEGDCIPLNGLSGPISMDPAKPVYICDGYRRKIMTMPPDRTDRIEVGGITMARLVEILSDDLGRPIIDRTGFTERFNLLLDFAPHQDLAVAASSGPTIFAAVEEQLGLRLRSAIGPVDAIVIKDVDRPSPN
jgi:uncharacterized protein (TIGR03435 family)